MRRRMRLFLVLAVGLAGAGIALAGVVPQGFATVSEVAAAPQQYAGHEVHVKAIVVAGSIARDAGEVRFAVTDGAAQVPVVYHGSLPDAFDGGRTVVVSGDLQQSSAGYVLVAHDLQGGCASKYEPAPGGA